jgi:hypothetical protein
MVKNTTINLEVIYKTAVALGELKVQVVYVGGATVSLYINDPAADEVRPTKDVDITLAISSLGELEAIRELLIRKGFKQSPEDDIICRFRYEDIKVDVMSTKPVGWAPANQWFAPGFAQKEIVRIKDQKIQILQCLAFKRGSYQNPKCTMGVAVFFASHPDDMENKNGRGS